jgi:hypothetical protein
MLISYTPFFWVIHLFLHFFHGSWVFSHLHPLLRTTTLGRFLWVPNREGLVRHQARQQGALPGWLLSIIWYDKVLLSLLLFIYGIWPGIIDIDIIDIQYCISSGMIIIMEQYTMVRTIYHLEQIPYIICCYYNWYSSGMIIIYGIQNWISIIPG